MYLLSLDKLNYLDQRYISQEDEARGDFRGKQRKSTLRNPKIKQTPSETLFRIRIKKKVLQDWITSFTKGYHKNGDFDFTISKVRH